MFSGSSFARLWTIAVTARTLLANPVCFDTGGSIRGSGTGVAPSVAQIGHDTCSTRQAMQTRACLLCFVIAGCGGGSAPPVGPARAMREPVDGLRREVERFGGELRWEVERDGGG